MKKFSVVFMGLMMEYTYFNVDVLFKYENFLSTFNQPTTKALSAVPTGKIITIFQLSQT